MCGIIGVFHRNPSETRLLHESDLARITHRGPDGSGLYSNPYVELGHTRLAILDLSKSGRQPMITDDHRYVIVFNGEIYNFIELRKELEARGEQFYTCSDTEVLLVAYKLWGKDCVNRFRGMFAFAIWDEEEKNLFLARDRCGEKPLYYYRDHNHIIFASELKALIPLINIKLELDLEIVDMYLHYQFVPEPLTLLKGIRKLPAAHSLIISTTNYWSEPKRYWNIENTIYEQVILTNRDEVQCIIHDSLEEAVKLALRADVPIGIPLSGGIDSSTIAALANKNYHKPVYAYCVGYPGRPRYDERLLARSFAKSLGITVHEIELHTEDFVKFFPELVRIMDEPIADPAAFGHYSIPKAASEHGVKVLLSGIGGDELFWGYPWVSYAVAMNQMLLSKPWLKPWLRLLAILINALGIKNVIDKASSHFPLFINYWLGILSTIATIKKPESNLYFYCLTPDFRQAFRIKVDIYGSDMLNIDFYNPYKPMIIGKRKYEEIPIAIIRLLFDTWLVSNCLTLNDRLGMAVGVEFRAPFLDVTLIERILALRVAIPDHHLGQKYWLKSAMKNVLPYDVLTRPKMGFQPPVYDWLNGVITTYKDVLLDGELVQNGILVKKNLNKLLQNKSGRILFFIYKLVLLEMWIQKVLKT